MFLSGIERLLWLASTVGNIAVLVAVFVRHHYRELPVFTALMVSNVLRTAILFFIYKRQLSDAYFYAYWGLAVVDLFLQSGVVYEIAVSVFRPAGVWAKDVRKPLLLIGGGAVLLALLLTTFAAGTETSPLEFVVVKESFLVSVLMTELFTGMVVLSAMVGLPWKGHVSHVAYPFGMYSTLDVLVEAAHTIFGRDYVSSTDLKLSECRAFAYVCCLVYWVVVFWQDAPARTERGSRPVDVALQWRSQVFKSTTERR